MCTIFCNRCPKNENGFINPAAGMCYEEYQAWLLKNEANALKTEVEDGWKVPQSTYWLYVDGRPVGIGKLRHCLTERLRQEGGHIGYAIAPEARGQGYGRLLLKGLLAEARTRGIHRALVTVHNNDNPASIRVALSCGGVVGEVNDERYLIWLDTSEA
ncbi:MAG: GNAT family N-acetyltransferase [Clostridia bacterium]|nr:GNAT family N-acetyltransferase [Clostridia bacterium]